MFLKANMRRHAWNCDLSTKPGTDILTNRHMYYTHTNIIIYTYPALYPTLSPSFCHLQEGSHLITLVRFPVGAIAKHAGSHSDAAAEPAWFWNTLWTVWTPLETHPRRTRTSAPGQKHKLLVDDGIFSFFYLNESNR